MIGIYVLAAIVVLALIFVKKTIVIIPQSETKIIERLGRYYATLRPGINIIIPFIDRAKEIVAMRNGRYMYTNTIWKYNRALICIWILSFVITFCRSKSTTCPMPLRNLHRQLCVTSSARWNWTRL